MSIKSASVESNGDHMDLVTADVLADAARGRPESAVGLIRAFNDSMSPTFTIGDLLVVDRRVTRIGADGIYAIVVNDRLLIRRVQRRMHDYLLISDNPVCETLNMPEAEVASLTIAGRIIEVWKRTSL